MIKELLSGIGTAALNVGLLSCGAWRNLWIGQYAVAQAYATTFIGLMLIPILFLSSQHARKVAERRCGQRWSFADGL